MSDVKSRKKAPRVELPVTPKMLNERVISYGKDAEIATIRLVDWGRKRHAYHWKEKDCFVPGVTSILKRVSKGDALVNWAANTAADFIAERLREGMKHEEMLDVCDAGAGAHNRIKKAAADIGKLVHTYAEARIGGRQLPELPNDHAVNSACHAFEDWLANVDLANIITEIPILSREHHYAGTADFFGRLNGELVVGDFKTSNGVYLEHRLQLAAYAAALEEETGERVNGYWLIRFSKKTGEFEPHYIPRSQHLIDAFRCLKELDERLKDLEAS